MLLPLLQNNLLTTAATGTVPSVVGSTQATATSDITTAGFVTAVVTDYSSTVAAGVVISQSPAGGSTATLGSTVTITVSLGARTNSGAGRPRRRRRYTIRIEGQIFTANSDAEAMQILEQAQALAEVAAKNKADTIVQRALPKAVSLGKVKPIEMKAPTISVSDELKAIAERVQQAIAKTYADESAHAELRLLLALRAAEEDDEEFLLLH